MLVVQEVAWAHHVSIFTSIMFASTYWKLCFKLLTLEHNHSTLVREAWAQILQMQAVSFHRTKAFQEALNINSKPNSQPNRSTLELMVAWVDQVSRTRYMGKRLYRSRVQDIMLLSEFRWNWISSQLNVFGPKKAFINAKPCVIPLSACVTTH